MTQIEENDLRTHAIIGAAMQVHRELGCGFLEPVYQEALALEFERQGVPFTEQMEFAINYRGRRLDASYRADFVCFNQLIVELKALATVGATEEAQLINYLKASGLELGLLLNFGARSLQFRRFILSKRGSIQSVQSAKSADDYDA